MTGWSDTSGQLDRIGSPAGANVGDAIAFANPEYVGEMKRLAPGSSRDPARDDHAGGRKGRKRGNRYR
jgi:hypothetical protein